MKKTFLVLALIVSQFSFAECLEQISIDQLDKAIGGSEYTVRIISAGCNIRHGVGEVEFASYHKDKKSWIVSNLNVVNDDLCKKDDRKPSKLVDIAFQAILGGDQSKLHKITVNPLGIVTNIEAVDASKGELKKIYSKFNLLDINKYPRMDLRVVEQDKLGWDKATIERVPGLIEMGKAKVE